MTTLLNEEIIKQVKDVFDAQLKENVQVMYFGSQDGCDQCEDTRQLIEEVTSISDKIRLSVHDLQENSPLAAQYKVTMSPGLVIAGLDGDQIKDYGIRFSGIPSGYEFTSLIQDIILVSGRDSGLSPETKQALQKLEQPVHLQVFVTPSCPYCPSAVVLAHQMAMESPMIQAEMVEAMEFPDLANRHNVSGVPQTTINDGAGTVVGSVPEAQLLAEIQRLA
ncbi:MAG: thioredoxin family protein [Anaerolineales bacterium]|nr:thioredoxin family protein [Anaerolineales bacterium]